MAAVSMQTTTEVDGRPFPLVINADHSSVDGTDLSAYLKSNGKAVLQLALTHGAVLFRGFGLKTPEAFAGAFQTLPLEKFPYVGGAAPRTNVVGDVVFTTNESPPSEPIPFHHEMAQCPSPPRYISFYCDTPSASGGETPIILSSVVCRYFRLKHPDFYKSVKAKGLRYIRVMPLEDDNSSAIGRSWKSTFQCTTKEEAEEAMRKIGTTWEWLENGDCRTTTAVVPAIKVDPRTGKEMFFNSMVAAYTGWVDTRNDPTKSVILGDGTPVDGPAILDIHKFQMANRVGFKWQAGDMLFIDNYVAMHSRSPFTKPRRILAAIGGQPIGTKQVPAVKGGDADGCEMPFHTLRSGDQMPMIGTGFWKVPKKVTPDVIVAAIKAGYRHLDFACDYGNEEQCGEGIRRAIDQGLVTREELWITSKLWNTYHAPEHVPLAIKRTLKDLGLDYLDLYLIHFPISLKFVPFETRYPPEWVYDPKALEPRMEFAQVPLHKTWAAMEKLVEAGLTRNIGVCNHTTQSLRDLLSYARIPPAVNQVEAHPLNTQTLLHQFCEQHGIAMTAFSPLASSSYEEMGWTKPADSPMTLSLVKNIAKKYKKTPAQILLRWGVQRGTSIIPKSTKEHRLIENINILDFSMTPEEMKDITALNCGHRFNDPGSFTLGMNTFCPIYE